MIGDFIILRRKELGLKRKELAERLDITYSYLSLIEGNRATLTEKLLNKMAKALDMQVSELKYYNYIGYGNGYKKEQKLIERQIKNVTKELAELEMRKVFLEKDKEILFDKLKLVRETEKEVEREVFENGK